MSLARFGLGVNIALHGWTRVFKFGDFTAHLDKQFANSILPHEVVALSSYAIVAGECTIGLLLLAGYGLRPTLTAGCWLMIALLFGSCLTQDWSAAGDQLIYLGFYTVLLALRSSDRWSLDACFARSVPPSSTI